jgi:acyl carrier protein
VIAEKTGYPVEMLELDMALDADLGIDSIKRVEILAALQERMPQAPVIQPEHLGTLQTLRHIVTFLAGAATVAPSAPAAVESTENQPQTAPPAPIDRSVVQAVPLSLAPRASVQPLAGTEIWIAGTDRKLAGAIQRCLQERGLRGRHLSWQELLHQERPALLGGLMLLAPAKQPSDDLLRQALLAVQHVGPGLRAAGRQGGAVLVSVSRLDGSFGLDSLDPEREPIDGGLAGLVKTAAHEWPEVFCKALDLGHDFSSVDEAAGVIVEEMLLAGPVEVGLTREGRRTLERAAAPLR